MASQSAAPARSRPFVVSEEEYPFSDHWFERGGFAMHFVDEGQGQPVLMLHGNPTWSFLYRHVIRALAPDFRAVAPDYPGFGMSDHPAGYGYTPAEHAQWISGFVESQGFEDIILVVQDWGGPIGFDVATRHPDRIAGIVICNTWAWAPGPSEWLFSRVMGGPIFGRYLQMYRNFFVEKIVPMGITGPSRTSRPVLDAYRAPFPTMPSRRGTWVFPREIRKSADWLDAIERRLPKLSDKPAEMVWAMNDPAFGNRRVIRRWQKHFPLAKLTRLPKASHYLQEDCPTEIASAVRRVAS